MEDTQSTSNVIAFVNGKSGGQMGQKVIKKLKKLTPAPTVYDLMELDQTTGKVQGPEPGLRTHFGTDGLKIICCGGDGTVCWILSVLDRMPEYKGKRYPPVSVIPLGTGNDMARVLRWGSGYNGEDLATFLTKLQSSEEILLDRWFLKFKHISDDEIKKLEEEKAKLDSKSPLQKQDLLSDDEEDVKDNYVVEIMEKSDDRVLRRSTSSSSIVTSHSTSRGLRASLSQPIITPPHNIKIKKAQNIEDAEVRIMVPTGVSRTTTHISIGKPKQIDNDDDDEGLMRSKSLSSPDLTKNNITSSKPSNNTCITTSISCTTTSPINIAAIPNAPPRPSKPAPQAQPITRTKSVIPSTSPPTSPPTNSLLDKTKSSSSLSKSAKPKKTETKKAANPHSSEEWPKDMVINNYFSIGVDSKIAMDFHTMRNNNPHLFSSKLVNYAWYGGMGLKAMVRSQVQLSQAVVSLKIDGNNVRISPHYEALVFLNIPSIYGGTNPWGEKNDGRKPPSVNDMLIEVLALKGAAHMATLQAGMAPNSGKRLGQGKTVEFVINQKVFAQVDGEPFIMPVCKATITHHNQATMLFNTDGDKDQRKLKKLNGIVTTTTAPQTTTVSSPVQK
eukprot:TRINITY_DN2157_c0_g1_i1.p1 TRINITY_DN2157_c0_g1~~TRINITY_DN2157_c0_g1_i1.p1  ORF type:complete len:625 (-),score=152.37 TRINITY_DN2157_c0_g1_i1:27-1865(-)